MSIITNRPIEDIIVDKMYSFVNWALSKKIKPNITKNNVTELTEQEIDHLKQAYEIEGVILDVDDTIRKDLKEIPLCNQEWLEMIKKKLKVIVVSNGRDKKMQEYFDSHGIDYISFAHKPLKKNFDIACKRMNLKPYNVLVIGDSLFSDIGMGKRYGAMTMKVDNVLEEK